MGTSPVFVYFYSSFRYLNKRRGKSKKHTAAKNKHIESPFRKADRDNLEFESSWELRAC